MDNVIKLFNHWDVVGSGNNNIRNIIFAVMVRNKHVKLFDTSKVLIGWIDDDDNHRHYMWSNKSQLKSDILPVDQHVTDFKWMTQFKNDQKECKVSTSIILSDILDIFNVTDILRCIHEVFEKDYAIVLLLEMLRVIRIMQKRIMNTPEDILATILLFGDCSVISKEKVIDHDPHGVGPLLA